MKTAGKLELALEALLFKSRWILAPFYGFLVVCIFILLIKFVQEFIIFIPQILEADFRTVILKILVLVDLTLVSNLLLIIVFSGYEIFVSKIDTKGHEDRPKWMGRVDFSELKIKLFGSIVAISGIELLKAFMLLKNYTNEQLAWLVGIHLTFVVSGLLFTYMEKVSAATKKLECEAEHVLHHSNEQASKK
ncbi:MAG: TIGR00645 family protein [Gammaproteobacteria bacterium]|nr:TIGR00645 family protein [Gammaproteobacteria bacterium]MDH5729899.1 TIGR00645 family protein [Gammaproteobacteria bacterium]